MSKPRVLIFIDWFYPGFKAGGPITSNLYLVERMNSLVDFYVVTSNTDYATNEVYSEVESDTWVQPKKEYNFKVYYASKAKQSAANWKALIREIQPQAIYVNGMYSRYYSILPTQLAQKFPVKTIVSPRGMLSSGSIGVKKIPKTVFLKLFNVIARFKNCVFHATSDHEVKDIQSVLGKQKTIKYIPNFNKPVPIIQEVPIKKKGELQLLTVARIAPEKNQLFAAQALLKCSDLVGLTWVLVGATYNESYNEKLQQAIQLLEEKGATVLQLGAKSPKEVAQLIKQSHVLYLPTTGENFGHAIFEAFCDSTPVLISNRTPWLNLSNQYAGYDLPLNETAFAQKVNYFKELNSEQYFKWTQGALKLTQEFNQKQELEQAYLSLFTK